MNDVKWICLYKDSSLATESYSLSLNCRVTAVSCLDPPPADGETCLATSTYPQPDANTGLYSYNTMIGYMCVGGRQFSDGHRCKIVSCSRNGEWNDTNVNCTRE